VVTKYKTQDKMKIIRQGRKFKLKIIQQTLFSFFRVSFNVYRIHSPLVHSFFLSLSRGRKEFLKI
jgi:hypothetical protein